MKITKYIIGLGIMAGTVISLPSCTDLSETVYDQVMSQNYYNTKQDVINAVFRPFEHIYESIVRRHEHEELTGGSVDNAYSGELGGMMAVNGKNIIIINTMTLIRKTGQTSGKACMAVSVNAIWCWMICLN